MFLDILKYRNSERDQRIYLKYYPGYSYFEETEPERNGHDESMPVHREKKPRRIITC